MFRLVIEQRVPRLLTKLRTVVAHGVGELGEEGDLLVGVAGNLSPGNPMIGQEGGATGGINQHLGVQVFRHPSGRANLQTDDGVALDDRGKGGGLDPDGTAFHGGFEQNLVEAAPHDIPGEVGNLLALFVAPHKSNPEVVFPIRAVENGAVFYGVTLGLDLRPEPEILQGKRRRSRQRLADMVARMIISFDDHWRDAVPKEIHRGGSASRTAAEDNNGMFLVSHDTETIRSSRNYL